MEGIIIEVKPEIYIIEIEGKAISAGVRGNVKKKDRLLVGDKVLVKKEKDMYIIEKVFARKNSMIRPPIANIDKMFCVVSKNYPVPDLNVLDKQILACEKNDILPIICINKIDEKESNENYEYIKKVYGDIGYKIIEISAKEGIGIQSILEEVKGSITAFSGLSGVGKSSITRLLTGEEEENIEVGNLMNKINRGKHTTKYVKLYYINGGYIADTPGFSSLELVDGIEKDDLKHYYREFSKYICKYQDCNHVTENIAECSIKKAVENGEIDSKRYERFAKLYKELEIKDKMKYKNKRR